jgi:hypothetical protein
MGGRKIVAVGFRRLRQKDSALLLRCSSNHISQPAAGRTYTLEEIGFSPDS